MKHTVSCVSHSFPYIAHFHATCSDGNRIDLTVMTQEYAVGNIKEDRLCKVLLDKDGLLSEVPAPSDESHWVKKPSAAEFICTIHVHSAYPLILHGNPYD